MRNINKLASLLDRAGKYNLADKLDKIAQSLSPGNNIATMDYKKDIEEYKRLLQSGDLQAANILKDNVISRYDEKSKLAFLAQANKIEEQLGNKYNKLSNITDDQLNNLLVRYKIYDATDLKSFNLSWNKMMQDLKSKNIVNNANELIFSFTYRNLATKFGYNRFITNVTGNLETDMDLYGRLFHNRLFTEAASLMSKVFSSDKYTQEQKEVFKLEADSVSDSMKYQSNKDFYFGGLDREGLIQTAKHFGVYDAKDINQFNNAWGKLINFYKKYKFPIYKKNPQAPTMYNYPGVAYQLENFKKQLMIQKGFTKINPSK